MNDHLKINLLIADINYPLTIRPEEEERIRKAAKQVNDCINRYRQHYKNLSLGQTVPMVAFHFALNNLQTEERNDTEGYDRKIMELTRIVEELIEEP
ncbi:MAG: cell division protein ZapA [Prevotellaceae bacterium]|jgi:cell division protein ZapA|nr:cell division protein ZapA [Prevotellaceae bacterium]